MPLVATILAKLLALQDWYLGQFVDVGVGVSISANLCYAIPTIQANVNPCGQESILGDVVEEWLDLLQAMTILIPSLFAFGSPHAV